MQVTVNIPQELAEKARARGVAVEAYVEEVLAQQIQRLPEKEKYDARSVGEAIDDILAFRKEHPLGEIKIKDLITEGRKY